jgi:hypothetical protein
MKRVPSGTKELPSSLNSYGRRPGRAGRPSTLRSKQALAPVARGRAPPIFKTGSQKNYSPNGERTICPVLPVASRPLRPAREVSSASIRLLGLPRACPKCRVAQSLSESFVGHFVELVRPFSMELRQSVSTKIDDKVGNETFGTSSTDPPAIPPVSVRVSLGIDRSYAGPYAKLVIEETR